MGWKKEECGLVGIITADSKIGNSVALTATTLQSIQHRGEEAAGITTSDGKKIRGIFGLGKVQDVYNEQNLSGYDDYHLSIGHTRYSITGVQNQKNIQPILVNHIKGQFSVAHNGNLINSVEIKQELEENGAIFQTTMDSEIFIHLIATSKAPNFQDAIIEAVKKTEGAFCLLIMTTDKIYAVRDRFGFHPLCWGEIDGTQIIASETCALDLIDARYRGQVHPGELVVFSKDEEPKVTKVFDKTEEKKCIFELIYFARPDSLIFGESVYQFRKRCGEILAEETGVDADYVIPIPDSGMQAGIGYAQTAGIPMEVAITKNHYVGRSFIQPTQSMRDHFVKMKLNPIKNMVNKKRIILVDDSIVRGTTTKSKIKALRNAGAREIHMRVAAPAITHPCFYGIDFPDKSKLIANQKSLEETRDFLGLDTLAYLSVEGLTKASIQSGFCTACFTGKYPTVIPTLFDKEIFEQ